MRIKLQMTTICGRQKNNDSFFCSSLCIGKFRVEIYFELSFFFEGKKHKLIG